MALSSRESSLPPFPEGLTPHWLTTRLRDQGLLSPTIELTSVKQSQVGDGAGMMSELARLTLTYSAPCELPATLIAKFPSRNPTNREVAMSYHLYEREVRYFAELDTRTTAFSPRTYLCAIDGDNFVILMEDMGAYRVGDQAAGADLADTKAMLEELVKLHAAFWNATGGIDWIPGIADSYHADNMVTLIDIGWPNMAQSFGEVLSRDIALRGEAFSSAVPELQARMHAAPRTLLHGDFRMENVFFGTQPQHRPIAIIDWQGPLQGNPMVDVALLLAQSTRMAIRREHERELVRQYADGLAKLGVDYDAEAAWADYQQAILYNWVYVGVVAGTLDVSNAKAFRWMSRMVARQSAASLDLDVFRLLPD